MPLMRDFSTTVFKRYRIGLVVALSILIGIAACSSSQPISASNATEPRQTELTASFKYPSAEYARAEQVSVILPLADNEAVERVSCDASHSVFTSAMLAAVNVARSQARVCGRMWFDAAPALRWNATLESMALGHSVAMAEKNFFSHDYGRSTMVSRADAAGYIYGFLSENIAVGQRDVDGVMAGWLASAGHCANIMQPEITEMGAACVRSDTADFPTYWTQNFARPR